MSSMPHRRVTVAQRTKTTGGSDMHTPSGPEPLLLRVPDAAARLGLGRSKFYELVRSKEIATVRIGRSVRVPVSALRAWVDAKLEEGARGT
jgi:excisionase family DNA binding protein